MNAREAIHIIIMEFCNEVARLDICSPFLSGDKNTHHSELYKDVPCVSRYTEGPGDIDTVSDV
jgi:hypothetical protein